MAQRQSPQSHHEGRGSSRQGPQSRGSAYRGQPSREQGQHREQSYEFGGREGADISSSNSWYSGYRGSEDRDYSASAQGHSGPPRDLQRSYGGQHRDNTQGGYGPPGDPGYGGYGPRGSYGHGPKGYKRSDERIREDVCERLGSQGEVDASEVEVQVQDGHVTLTGTVTHQRDKRHLEDLAEVVPGVQEVITELRVHRTDQQRGSSGATASTADRSSATDQRQRSDSAASQGAPAPTERPKGSGKRASA